jgi:aminoglycoside/choline kinase family phosphotransferase
MTKRPRDDFTAALAICTPCSAILKLPVFSFASPQRDGKPSYLGHMPRILAYLRTQLDAPALKPVCRLAGRPCAARPWMPQID